MIDFSHHVRWAIGALAVYSLMILSVGLTLGVWIDHAMQTGP